MKYSFSNNSSNIKKYISNFLDFFEDNILIFILVSFVLSEFTQFMNPTKWTIYANKETPKLPLYLNSFAGLRSETQDMLNADKDEISNRSSPKVKTAREFVNFNFDSVWLVDEESNRPKYNLEKLKNIEFQNEMKKYRVQVRRNIDGKLVYFGSDSPVYVVSESGGAWAMENPDEVINEVIHTTGEKYFGRNPASANGK
jgi:hypothetical protein